MYCCKKSLAYALSPAVAADITTSGGFTAKLQQVTIMRLGVLPGR